ncbi:MAG: ACT domain-containing protein [Candidatus Altiarchaeales archaeon]|nr:ACT domain-containing protein [Candidatus Altiarchaeales archaeon]MBD3417254.1 ACT domain-containing protein [Candidatus Altiarchaeales archaeon]
MRVDVSLGLRDVPGMLVRALEPISANGGNIVSVLHSRGSKGLVGVDVVFKVRDQESLSRILGALKKEKVRVRDVRVEGHRYYKKRSLSFIFVGHVIDNDIQDTIDRINELGLVRDVDVRMTDPEAESAVLMEVDVDDNKHGKLMDVIQTICREKRFLFINEVAA